MTGAAVLSPNEPDNVQLVSYKSSILQIQWKVGKITTLGPGLLSTRNTHSQRLGAQPLMRLSEGKRSWHRDT